MAAAKNYEGIENLSTATCVAVCISPSKATPPAPFGVPPVLRGYACSDCGA
jgi:hypothetical protein